MSIKWDHDTQLVLHSSLKDKSISAIIQSSKDCNWETIYFLGNWETISGSDIHEMLCNLKGFKEKAGRMQYLR